MQEAIETTLAMPGVIAVLWAVGEDGGDAGGDAGALADTSGDIDGEELETAGEAGEAQGEEVAEGEERVDGRRGSKEMREALKAWEATPEGAKYAKQLRADHFRIQELNTIEPGGVTKLRENYALLESVGGVEGLTQMQERVAEVTETDALIAAGDPKGLEMLGADFTPGLAKLTPAILDRVMQADPAAYAAAILPHLMNSLSGSPMVADLNKMVDIFEAPHLDDAKKLEAIKGLLGRIGSWYAHNEKRVGDLKTAPVDKGRQEIEQGRADLAKQQQDHHWNTQILPNAAKLESDKFTELLKPLKLTLTEPERKAAITDFRAKLSAACKADPNFGRAMKAYRAEKNPDSARVLNFLKVTLGQKAKTAFDSVKAERWPRAGSATRTTTQKPAAGAGGQRTAGAGTGGSVIQVSRKPAPEDIDYTKTSEADQWNKTYTLKDGKRVKWVKPQ